MNNTTQSNWCPIIFYISTDSKPVPSICILC